LAGIISDKILKSRKRVLIVGTLAYTVIWAIIWLTAGSLGNYAAQFAINFSFGFFGGFFVVSYAQIKELFPIYIAGTSTAALNLFPFAGGAILQLLSGYMVVDKTLAQFQNLWLLMFIMMVIASIAALMSLEAKDIERREAKKG
ncbi:MAG: MFS transporter, partial [Candidatus Methanomethylophilaceae archaeon]